MCLAGTICIGGDCFADWLVGSVIGCLVVEHVAELAGVPFLL